MKLIEVPVSQVYNADHNPARRSNPKYRQDLVKSIAKYGQLQPALAYKYNGGYKLIDGHGRKCGIIENGIPTIKLIVVSASDAAAVFGEVNRTARKLTGNDILVAYGMDPHTVGNRISKELEGWGDAVEYVANHGGSISTLRQASSVADYTGVDRHKVARWIVNHRQTYRVRRAIEDGITPGDLATIIESGKPLVNRWGS